jgi:hypothetical protein
MMRWTCYAPFMARVYAKCLLAVLLATCSHLPASQIGTVVDDALDFYGGRLSAGQRKATLTEQLLADQELQHTRKKRYGRLQVGSVGIANSAACMHYDAALPTTRPHASSAAYIHWNMRILIGTLQLGLLCMQPACVGRQEACIPLHCLPTSVLCHCLETLLLPLLLAAAAAGGGSEVGEAQEAQDQPAAQDALQAQAQALSSAVMARACSRGSAEVQLT